VSTPSITYTLVGTTAVVRMDDGKANALNDATIDALAACLTRAESEAKALALLGRPDRFCGGFDLRAMMASNDSARALMERGGEMFLKVYGSPLPVVVGCTGHSMAAGLLLVLCGDVRIGAAGPYKLQLNEVAIGFPLPMLGMELARAHLVATELTRATLLAHLYSPEEAARAGFLDRVVPADELEARVLEEAARLGALGRNGYAQTKQRLRGHTIDLVRANLANDLASLRVV
jgi:enoyl-CoA hydratase